MEILFFVISFFASVVGAICGIGGGIVIKPVLDLSGLAGVAAISFLSGCTVLSMSLYSVGMNVASHSGKIDYRTGTPLALGGAVGGILGKGLFDRLGELFSNQNHLGAVQAVCLAVVTVAAYVYTLKKDRIKTFQVTSLGACFFIGLLLGLISSFLGIGGGPINLVVLFFFFSMETKTAAQNSLYIILFSQITSLLTTLVTHRVPEFSPRALLFMVAGGIGGGIAGRWYNERMNTKAVDRLFRYLMGAIIVISVYNMIKYAQLR